MAKKFGFEINADTSGLDKSLKQATSSIDSFAKRNEATFKRVGSAVQNVGKSLSIFSAGVVAAAGGAFLLAKKAGEAADRLLDLEQITGLSTDTLQEYQFVAKIAGVNTEALSNASQGLTRRLAGATSEASPLNVALAQLGVTVKDATGGFKSSEVVMDDLITKLSSMDDQTQRNVLGAQIFGGAWKDLAPIFALGADGIADARKEARDLGLVLDKDALDGANNFRIALGKLTERLKAMQFRLGAKLAPLLQNTILPLFEKKIIPAIEKMAAFLERLILRFQNLSPPVQKAILIFGGLITALGPVLFIFGKLISTIPVMIGGLVALRTAFIALSAAVYANPLGALVVVIGTVIGAMAALKRTTDSTVKSIDLYAEVNKTAEKSIAAERAELTKLLSIARDEQISKKERLEAVKKLNELSPKYLGNLKLEAINNDKAREAVDLYTESLINNARVKAAESKLIELQSKRIELELEQAARVKAIKEGENSLIKKNTDNAFANLTAQNLLTNAKGILTGQTESLNKELQAEEDLLLGIIKGADRATQSFKNLADAIAGRTQQTPTNAGLQPQGITADTSIAMPDAERLSFMTDKVEEELWRLRGLMHEFNLDMNELIMGSITDTFNSLGDAIGNALASGGNVLKAVGQTLLKSLGNFISDMGGMLIKYGTLAVAKGKLDLAIAIPGAGIAAGAAAIAVGVALKAAGAAIASKASGQGGGGRSGNTTPEVSNTRVNTSVGASGMDVVFRIAGRDLVSVIDRNRNHLDRIGG